MTTISTAAIRSKTHTELAEIIEQDEQLIIDRWAARAIEELPQSKRLHHTALRDHLPQFLLKLGRSLRISGPADGHVDLAEIHGEERWEQGWSLEEVVQDYQLLRLVLIDHLEVAADRPLQSQEHMAIGLALDEAIAASVTAFPRASESQLVAHNQELKDSEHRRDQFLAVLGHELRNPLSAICTVIDLLRLDGRNLETLDEGLNVLERQSKLFTRLVEDLLDYSRMAQSKLRLICEPVDLKQIVRDVTRDLEPTFAESGLSLAVSLPDAPLSAIGDRTRLHQVLMNLLNNARKFTESGGRVEVGLTVDENRHAATVTIRDSGIGMEPELLPVVFEPFSQGRQRLEHGRTGLGLGLAIVKRLVALHDGTIQVRSDGVGKGSEFTIQLPLARQSEL